MVLLLLVLISDPAQILTDGLNLAQYYNENNTGAIFRYLTLHEYTQDTTLDIEAYDNGEYLICISPTTIGPKIGISRIDTRVFLDEVRNALTDLYQKDGSYYIVNDDYISKIEITEMAVWFYPPVRK